MTFIRYMGVDLKSRLLSWFVTTDGDYVIPGFVILGALFLTLYFYFGRPEETRSLIQGRCYEGV